MNDVSDKKSSILVVDDTHANLRFLVEILTEQGYLVRPTLDGTLALASAKADPPDLILLDIMMPHIDGYEVCDQLKADPVTHDIPVIFLSALDEVLDKVRAFAAGGVDYITKPFQTEEVLVRIQTHLALRKLQEDLQLKNQRLQEEIAERRRAEIALQEHARQLEARNAELDAFAHTVAHDLRNPLSLITGYSSLLEELLEDTPDTELRKYVGVIARSSVKLDNIIDALLLLASVRQMDDIPQDVIDMAEVVTEARNRLQDVADKSAAEFAAPAVWPEAVGYAPWIEEVWANYISNALKYGGRADDGIPPRIELGFDEAAGEGSQIRFWVRDNGLGLSAKAQEQLFTPFTRLGQVRIKGHGLGLSIVRRIMTRLGGEVGVDSVEGEGSTFWFTLPDSA